jgi:hypothetical protein
MGTAGITANANGFFPPDVLLHDLASSAFTGICYFAS